MSINSANQDNLPNPNKDQLLPERAFIDYCRLDYHHNLKLDINIEFLRAAEADNFLHPLLMVKENVKQEDGSEKEVVINYYSPHQVYVITALSKNQVHKGLLWTKSNIEFYEQQGYRMVNWGSGYTFNITLEEKSRKLRIVDSKQVGNGHMLTVESGGGSRRDSDFDHLEICSNFHNFLTLLHSLEQLQFSPTNYREKSRLFSEAPSLLFDLSPLKIGSEKILKKYGLDLVKMKRLARSVASLASHIDPLEHWYYYINLHPQWRKDLFKGDAALAQDIYRIYDLIKEVIEIISGEKQPPMFEFMYGEQNINPYLIPRVEYVNGTDVNSMFAAIKKFKEWIKLENNKDFVKDDSLASLGNFERELKEYEEKYGARSFISNGVRAVEVEDSIKLDDLDLKTRQYVNQIVQQAKAQLVESKRQFLSLWDDDFEEKVKKNELSLTEAKQQDSDLFVKREIFDAIENRLRSLKRELWGIFNNVQQEIAKKVNEAWDIEHNFSNHFWFKRNKELKALLREKQLELYRVEYDKAYKKAQYWSKKRDKFGEVEYVMELLFCSSCRQKPVVIHQSHNDGQISNNSICDDCIKSTVDLRTLGSEMKCDFCGKLLYKFANRNILNDLLFNAPQSTATLILEYGRLQVKIKCPNKECAEDNTKWIDWGWLP
ncbi:MAG: hypothetical protein Q8P26_03835 [Candidatus Levybacteria bacterium]|nr:hypothetical protein [Candidatus Levybacteria bacterium]